MALIGHQTMRQMMIHSYSIIFNHWILGTQFQQQTHMRKNFHPKTGGSPCKLQGEWWVHVPPSSRDIPGTWKSSDRSHGFREAQRPQTTKGEAMEVAGRNLVEVLQVYSIDLDLLKVSPKNNKYSL